MPVFRLSDEDISFPPAYLADEYGRLAIGGDLAPERLLLAYQSGLFPWFNPDEPIVWWSPDPRFVLFPDELKVAKSMRPIFNQNKFTYSFDQHFRTIITTCRQERLMDDGSGTWITDTMVEAYCRLHELGFAHSVEVFKDGEIVGGLYGISLGKVFFGESMFAKASNASKAGFITLVNALKEQGFWLIDCQQETDHLRSLGGVNIPRQYFLELMEKNQQEKTLRGSWSGLI